MIEARSQRLSWKWQENQRRTGLPEDDEKSPSFASNPLLCCSILRIPSSWVNIAFCRCNSKFVTASQSSSTPPEVPPAAPSKLMDVLNFRGGGALFFNNVSIVRF
ncbi:hypothetical protein V7S43_017291 [Phytophthora oleae]|uniref:Uncharacterized protein n=1 Tax=Phytophthora oleae TaxID=2107226 RepID=A0ABD3EWP2_9STRA